MYYINDINDFIYSNSKKNQFNVGSPLRERSLQHVMRKIICFISSYFFMKVSKSNNRFKTGFQEPKICLRKNHY